MKLIAFAAAAAVTLFALSTFVIDPRAFVL